MSVIWIIDRYNCDTWSVTSGFSIQFFKIEIYPFFLLFHGAFCKHLFGKLVPHTED